MAGFHYEKNLPHQMKAVQAVLNAFDRAIKQTNGQGENPSLTFHKTQWQDNIHQIQKQNGIENSAIEQNGDDRKKVVLDISMETGTGKTYTYTQTMYEMHQKLGLYKFVIAVPTLSIKAGTENFLKSDALKQHFRLDFDGQYGETEIELYTVHSQKSKNQVMPSEIVRFVQADNTKKIHVLLLNMGMINSKTMKGEDMGNDGSVLIKDLFNKPVDAIASVKPILIIDEPHRFDEDNKAWENLMALKPQFVLRYGATFNDKFYNLIYRLSAIDAFNQDLVKGVRAFIEKIDGDGDAKAHIKLVRKLNNNEALFELSQNNDKQQLTLSIGESLGKIHHAIDDLVLTKIHKNQSLVVFNDDIELKSGASINPYSYSNTVSDKMIRQAVQEHFKTEKELLSRYDKIKPLTLFFIDDIAGYRDENGSLRKRFEACVLDEAKEALQTAEPNSHFYASLQSALNNVGATHSGYFSKDNSSNDEKTAQEIKEILHDKESLLSLNNPRRFIFSKWTLREGWDNPNVFGICKLRSSGSETSKLQEVGRGLRLPVNEFMARVKDGDFKLNYFVDNSEADFVKKLTDEVNNSVKEIIFKEFSQELFQKIKEAYPDVKKRALSDEFFEKAWINDNDEFINDGFAQVEKAYPNAFGKVKIGKITEANQTKAPKVKMRMGKYDELKTLWEAINQKAILRYQISEPKYEQLFVNYLLNNRSSFTQTGIRTNIQEIKINKDNQSLYSEHIIENDDFIPIVTMNYRKFLEKLSQVALIQINTLHRAFHRIRNELDIEKFMNDQTVSTINRGFNKYLFNQCFNQFQIAYDRVSSAVHPTKFTNQQGNPLNEVNANDLGTNSNEELSPLEEFLFDQVFYDSDIEKKNITTDSVKGVTVFTKIPKNSIKIPVAGGGTYSPDFAYILETNTGDILNLVIESKNVEDIDDLRNSEIQKIKHAEKWFKNLSNHLVVKFETQFKNDTIHDIIKKALKS